MYAVGVGNAVEDELKEIASEPTAEHYFYTADFKTMTQIAKKLQINICQGQPLLLALQTTNSSCDYSFLWTPLFCSHRRRPLWMWHPCKVPKESRRCHPGTDQKTYPLQCWWSYLLCFPVCTVAILNSVLLESMSKRIALLENKIVWGRSPMTPPPHPHSFCSL